MEDKTKQYLSVKEIARIKDKHEETIRRWINANKIEVPKFASKKEGYSIPVESLIQNGILTRDEVEKYLMPTGKPDPRAEIHAEKDIPLPDWQSLIKKQDSATGEELLQLITELNHISQEYGRKKKSIAEQILKLKNQIVELEYDASSCEMTGQQINDYITFLRNKL